MIDKCRLQIVWFLICLWLVSVSQNICKKGKGRRFEPWGTPHVSFGVND